MRTINVNKSKLISIVRENRDNHKKLFEEAWDGYRTKVIKDLEARLGQIKDGGAIELYLDLVRPEDHTEDYERVLQMLDFHTEDEIELTEGEFKNYVQDDWNWTPSFTTQYAVNGPH